MSGEIFAITVNGHEHKTSVNKKLIRFLRDDLRLTSVKDGCSEGVCGTCTVIADGKPVRACIMTTKQADGKSIITAEGLSDTGLERSDDFGVGTHAFRNDVPVNKVGHIQQDWDVFIAKGNITRFIRKSRTCSAGLLKESLSRMR